MFYFVGARGKYVDEIYANTYREKISDGYQLTLLPRNNFYCQQRSVFGQRSIRGSCAGGIWML